MSRDGRANEAFDLLKQGRHKEARAILEKIVEDDSADAAVLETLGDVREKLGDKAGALDAYVGAVTHLRARGEHKRALGVVELMLIVEEQSVTARREAAEIRLEMGDEPGCWREATLAVMHAVNAQRDAKLAGHIIEQFAVAASELAPSEEACRRVASLDKTEAARVARVLAEELRKRGKLDESRALSALAIEFAPGLKDVLHPKVPIEERTDEPWAEKTPEVPAVGLGTGEDDEPTDMDR